MADRSISETQDAILALKIAELLATGLTAKRIRNALSIDDAMYYRVMRANPDALKRVHEEVQIEAVSERRRNLEVLAAIRDEGENDNARVRAIEAIDARAGLKLDKGDAGITVQIFGEQINVNALTGQQMDLLALALAKDIGPETRRVIEAEFAVRTVVGEAQDGGPPGQAGGAGEPAGGADEKKA